MMLKVLLKKQWKSAVLIVVFFCGLLFMKNGIETKFTHRYLEPQRNYMKEYNLADRDVFFASLIDDRKTSNKVITAIENFESYDKEIFEELIDPVLMAGGEVSYVNSDMVVWREEMLQMPGQYTQTVSDDYYMLIQLSQRLYNQENFEELINNSMEIMHRGIRRNDALSAVYKVILEQLNQIDDDFSVQDTILVDDLLGYLETDIFILIIIVLIGFAVFSGAHQNGISKQIKISKMNAKKYSVKQILAAFVISIISNLIYYVGILLVFAKGNLHAIPWSLPIQAINNYENITIAISVWQYIVIFIAFKMVFVNLLLAMVLFVSAISKNNIISALISFTLCGSTIVLHNMTSASFVIGSAKDLMEGLGFFLIGELVVPLVLCVAIFIVVGMLILNTLTICGYGIITKKWIN